MDETTDHPTTTSETSSGSKPFTKRARSVLDIESKRDRFVRLANGRTKRALHAIRQITKLGRNRRHYDFSQADADAIAFAIRSELEVMEQSMNPPGHQLDIEFDLVKEITG